MTQLSRIGQVTDSKNLPVPGASIYVYDQDGNAASLTSDGTTALPQPLTTDEFGNYSYYAIEGYYREDTWFGGKLRYREDNIALGNPGADLDLRSDLATAGSGAALVEYSVAGTYGAGTVGAKLKQIKATADYSSHAAADAAGAVLYVPTDITSTRASGSAVISRHWGPGQVTTADGNKRGQWFANVTAAPASTGDQNSIETAFNGDLKTQIAMEHRITGAATLGQPTSGYLYTPEAYAQYGFLYNSAGWNNGTADNSGRTAACFHRVRIYNAGQGDAVAYNFSGYVTGSRAGATHFLANPAACGFNGNVNAGSDGVYLNPFETTLHDNGFDVAGVGCVVNLDRTNATGALGCYWNGFRAQSIGTAAADATHSASGKFNVGIDYTGCDFGTNLCAMALKRGQRIYGNASTTDPDLLKATSLGTDYLTNSSSGWDFYIGGTLAFRASATTIQLATTTVAALPTAGTAGRRAFVTDATATTFASTVAGGGTNKVPVYDDGSAWKIG